MLTCQDDEQTVSPPEILLLSNFSTKRRSTTWLCMVPARVRSFHTLLILPHLKPIRGSSFERGAARHHSMQLPVTSRQPPQIRRHLQDGDQSRSPILRGNTCTPQSSSLYGEMRDVILHDRWLASVAAFLHRVAFRTFLTIDSPLSYRRSAKGALGDADLDT